MTKTDGQGEGVQATPKTVGWVLRWEDYDFSAVPKKQLKACLLYEYARESARITEQVLKIRRQVRQQVDERGLKAGDPVEFKGHFTKVTKGQSPTKEGFIFCEWACRPGFPEVPWQLLDRDCQEHFEGLEERAVKKHNEAMLRDYPPVVLDGDQGTTGLDTLTLSTWKQNRTPKLYLRMSEEIRSKRLVSGFIQLNFGHTPRVLIEGFTEWIRSNHPKGRERPRDRRGRNAPLDRLHALGALRLRYHCCTLKEAQALTAKLKNLDTGLHYADRTGWNRACERAVEYFAEVCEVPGELPLHFTKGWQK